MTIAEAPAHEMPSPLRVAGIVAMLVLFLLATTYPFTWLTNSAVRTDGSAVFPAPGILRTAEPFAEFADLTDGLSVALDAKPFLTHQFGPARLLSIGFDHHHGNLILGQQNRDLVVRVRRAGSSEIGTPAYVASNVFQTSVLSRMPQGKI